MAAAARPDGAPGTRFTWTRFDVGVDTVVTGCVAPERIAWRDKLCAQHPQWLEGLARVAVAGMPD